MGGRIRNVLEYVFLCDTSRNCGIKVQPSDAIGRRLTKNLHKQNFFMKSLKELHKMFLLDTSKHLIC